MDETVLRELALWATAGGGGLFVGVKLVQRLGASVRAAVAADDKSVSLLDRLERQLAAQEARFRAAEDRHLAHARHLEARIEAAAAHADRAERERNEALVRAERLALAMDALRAEADGPRGRCAHGAGRFAGTRG
ncbi:MAG: hypothetical protein PGN26_12995 [Xylophilus ampelinus]